MTDWAPRPATSRDLPGLAHLWHDGWHEAHSAHVPAGLTRLRTLESFRERLSGFGDGIRTAGPDGAPLALCVIREREMHQLYVAQARRGLGLATRLLADAEQRLALAGVFEAWLDVIAENPTARRVYARAGWQDQGLQTVALDTSQGPFPTRVIVMTKRLDGTGPGGT